MSPIPIDRNRCKAIVKRNVGRFRTGDTDAEVCAHTRAPLFVFQFGHPTASLEIGERPFLFSDGCDDGGARLKGLGDTHMSKEGQENAVPAVVSGDRGLDSILGKGSPVSIEDDKFSLVVSRSIDSEIVDPILAEIKAKREKLKIRHVIASVVCFSILGLIAYYFFPRVPTTPVAGAWDELNVKSEPYETEATLIGSLRQLVNMEPSPNPKQRMSQEQRTIADKYRKKNVRKVHSDYMKDVDKYLTLFSDLVRCYEDVELKEYYIEGVLKSFPWDENGIGLRRYANEIKKEGDKRYLDRAKWIERALDWCDIILESLKDDDAEVPNLDKKRLCVKLQKAQLLMYKWLVENVKTKKGGKVKYFPDDKGDTGVDAREEAVRIIREGVSAVPEGRKLYNQCIEVLVNDSSWLNSIYFGGEKWSNKGLGDQRYKL